MHDRTFLDCLLTLAYPLSILGIPVVVWLSVVCFKTCGPARLPKLLLSLLIIGLVGWFVITGLFLLVMWGGDGLATRLRFSVRLKYAVLGFGVPIFVGMVCGRLVQLYFTKAFPELVAKINESSPEAAETPLKPQLCLPALISLILVVVPILGLPLALYALKEIKRSQGRLSGRKLALVALGLNSLLVALILAITIAMNLFAK